MNTYRCKFKRLEGDRAIVELLDDHKALGGDAGDICITSKVKMIDFERGIIITQNSIYLIKERLD